MNNSRGRTKEKLLCEICGKNIGDTGGYYNTTLLCQKHLKQRVDNTEDNWERRVSGMKMRKVFFILGMILISPAILIGLMIAAICIVILKRR